jgi:hypothetical protein
MDTGMVRIGVTRFHVTGLEIVPSGQVRNPEPSRHRLEQGQVAIAPLLSAQQRGGFAGGHLECGADGGGRGQALLAQGPANQHAEPDDL